MSCAAVCSVLFCSVARYEVDGAKQEAVYDDDDTICISVVKDYDHEPGIKLSLVAKSKGRTRAHTRHN